MQGSDVATDALVDRQLVRQLCAGDAVALEAIYRRHSRLVFTLIVRILRDRHEAEDVLEDVFFELWRSADRFDESRGTVRAFLVTLARSRAIDRLRKRDGSTGTRPIVRTVGDDTPERANEPKDDPAMRADLEERRTQVAKALNELEPGTRELIERSFYEGQSHTEIAESLGKPLGSVKTQIRRGLQTMAKVLKTVQSILM